MLFFYIAITAIATYITFTIATYITIATITYITITYIPVLYMIDITLNLI